MAKMTKAQMVAALADKTNLTKKDVAALVGALHELAVKEVKKNGQFVLGDFGKLVKAHRAARMGRNPQTGEAIKIPAKTVVKFRLSKSTKEALV
jgi:DNA-binding protein HU-beta